MRELVKEILKEKRYEALESEEAMRVAAREMGYSEQEIEEALNNFEGFPLDDDDLVEIAGGFPVIAALRNNRYQR